jgi:uncharacterized protein (TIGR00290 family)
LKKAAIFWSGGKDSAMALGKVLEQKNYEIKYLITTMNESLQRVSMHGLRISMIEKQSKAIGIPLLTMLLSEGTHEEYEVQLIRIFEKLKNNGITNIIYGDIFLEDLRIYRDKLLHENGMKGIYPLWKMQTQELLNEEFFMKDYKALICCADADKFEKSIAGSELNEQFIEALPFDTDPCGENGEFHTFCYYAPYFSAPIEFTTGEKTLKTYSFEGREKGFWFIDLIPSVQAHSV